MRVLAPNCGWLRAAERLCSPSMAWAVRLLLKWKFTRRCCLHVVLAWMLGCSGDLEDANRCKAFAENACDVLCDPSSDCMSSFRRQCKNADVQVVDADALDACLEELDAVSECVDDIEPLCALDFRPSASAADAGVSED